MKIIILTAIVIMAVRGQMMYSSLLPSQYQKSSSLLGTYPANYTLKFIPYPMNYPQTFHPNYPMNMHQYPNINVAQIPMQVPQTQDFPLTNYPLNIQQHPLQASQITVQIPQTQDAPVVEKAKIPKIHQIQRRFQRVLEPLQRNGRNDLLSFGIPTIEGLMEGVTIVPIKNIFRTGFRIITLLKELHFNPQENIDNITSIFKKIDNIKSIFKKEFNLNLTDFEVKGFLPPVDEEEVEKIFEFFGEIATLSTFLTVNTDKNGELSLQELTTFIKSIRPEFIPESLLEEEFGQMIIKRFLSMIDFDGDDKLSFEECQKFMHEVFKIRNEESFPAIGVFFLFVDTDKNDRISRHELSSVIKLDYEYRQKFFVQEGAPFHDKWQENSEKFVDAKKFLKIMSRESVRDSFIRASFAFADSDENDELSRQEISFVNDLLDENLIKSWNWIYLILNT